MIATFVLATLVTWQFPRTATCHEGMPFADGRTGVLVWGDGDTVNLTFGRGDLWDHRGGYAWTAEQSYTNIVAAIARRDNAKLRSLFRNEVPANWGDRYNPYMLPLGRVVVSVPGRTLARGTLETSTGLGTLAFADGTTAELAFPKASRQFAIRFPDDVEWHAKTVPATSFPVWEILRKRGFEKAVVKDAADGLSGGLAWKLPADPAVCLAWRKTGGTFAVTTGRGAFAPCAPVPFARLAAESLAQWRAYWAEGARIRVPDPVIQEIFDFGQYKFGAMTDPDGFPAGLQGQWLEDDKLVPWCGDYHFNINIQECYSPAFRGGHFRNLKPLFDMVLSWRPILRANAKNFVGIDDGYVLPHSVDDRGVCIGGFWAGTIDHASTAWIAALMMRYVRYAGDVGFLRRDAFDFMSGAMKVYRAMMVEHEGRLSLPSGPSPEWGGSDVTRAVGRDPSFQLAAAHRLARDLIDAARILGREPDPMWLDVDRRLPDYTALPPTAADEWGGAGGIALFEGQPLAASHRHHSHLAGFYPFDTIDMEKDRATVNATYRQWVWKGFGEWSGWSFPWASILHTHVGDRTAAVWMLKVWNAFYCNPGHGSRHDVYEPGFSGMRRGRNAAAFGVSGDAPGEDIMQMDGQCAAVTAVMELLAHETNGKVEFFKGCPDDWQEVAFENLALSDGRRVSGRRYHGKDEITYAR